MKGCSSDVSAQERSLRYSRARAPFGIAHCSGRFAGVMSAASSAFFDQRVDIESAVILDSRIPGALVFYAEIDLAYVEQAVVRTIRVAEESSRFEFLPPLRHG